MTKNNLKVVKSTKAQQAEGNEKNKALLVEPNRHAWTRRFEL